VTFQVDSVQTNSGSEASQAVLSEPVCTQRLSAEFSAANDNHSRDFVNAETSDHAGVLQQQADISESQVKSSIVADVVQNSSVPVSTVSDMNEMGSRDCSRNAEQSPTLPDSSVSLAETNSVDVDVANTDVEAAITFHVPARLACSSEMADVLPRVDASVLTHPQTTQAVANEPVQMEMPSEPCIGAKQKIFPTCLEDIEHRLELDDYKSVVSTAVVFWS
jgi:hypothetical protein